MCVFKIKKIIGKSSRSDRVTQGINNSLHIFNFRVCKVVYQACPIFG